MADNDFDQLYKNLESALCSPGEFSALMLEVGVNPLDYMEKVPDRFLDYAQISNIIIPNHIKSLGKDAFSNNEKLAGIKLPNSVTAVGNGAFYHCTNLVSIDMNEGIISIGEWAFCGCDSLETISIPSTVTFIGTNAFKDCGKLKELTYEGTKAQWRNLKKNPTWRQESSIKTIRCVDGDINLNK